MGNIDWDTNNVTETSSVAVTLRQNIEDAQKAPNPLI